MSLTTDWTTRPETSADREQVYGVNASAFGTDAEAGLVDALREDPGAWLPGLSYVAEAADGTIAAYALITRCHVDEVPALALAPVAVLPEQQRQGAERPSYARRWRRHARVGSGSSSSWGIRSTTRASASYVHPSTASGRVSTFRTRR